MVARIVQAIGTALLLPVMFNTILLIFRVGKRSSAMVLMERVIMFAPNASAIILYYLTWHNIFKEAYFCNDRNLPGKGRFLCIYKLKRRRFLFEMGFS